MSDFLIRNKDLLASVASVTTMVSLFFVLIAAFANRKQNILKTTPILAMEMNKGKLVLKNLNQSFAYNFHSEKFYIKVLTEKVQIIPPGWYAVNIDLSGKNYISSKEDSKALRLKFGKEYTDDELWHYFFQSWLSVKGGVNFLFYDSQNHRFITRLRTNEFNKSPNSDKERTIGILVAPRFAPWYDLRVWVPYGMRTVNTYRKVFISKIKEKIIRGEGWSE